MSKAKTFSISKLTKKGLKEYLKKNPNHKCGVSSTTTCPIAGYIRSQAGPTNISVENHVIIVGEQRYTKKSSPAIPTWVPAFIKEFDSTFDSETVSARRVLELL